MNGFLQTLIQEKDEKKRRKLQKKLAKYESITDNMEVEITAYITKLADREITSETSIRLRTYMNIANDLERIGDIYFQIGKNIEVKNEKKIYFLPEQRQSLLDMLALVSEGFEEMVRNLEVSDYATVSKDKARDIEDRINKKRNEMRKINQDKLGEAGYPVEAAMTYNTIFSSLERVGDHLINVTESVVGEI